MSAAGRVCATALLLLAALACGLSVRDGPIGEPTGTTRRTVLLDPSYTLTALNARAAWAASNGSGSRVFVLGEGAQLGHRDLPTLDAAASRNFAYDGWPARGTAVDTAHASFIAAADNDYCGTGVAPGAAVISAVVLHRSVAESIPATKQALRYAATMASHLGPVDPADMRWPPMPRGPARGPSVVTMTWGPLDTIPQVYRLPADVQELFAHVTAQGIAIVLSAGNGDAYGDHMALDGFASNRHVIAVGALNPEGSAGFYSEHGGVAVAGPAGDVGVRLLAASADGCGPFASATGTAAAAVAGVVALLRPGPGRPPLTPWDVLDVLAEAANHNLARVSMSVPWTRNGAGLLYSDRLGFGVPDAAHAVQLAANRTARWVARTATSTQATLSVYEGGRETTVEMRANGTIVWCAVVGTLAGYNTCALGHVSRIYMRSPAGVTMPVFKTVYVSARPPGTEMEFPTRGFLREPSAGTWAVGMEHSCPRPMALEGARVECVVV